MVRPSITTEPKFGFDVFDANICDARKHIDSVGKAGSTVGVDMCGTIEEVGKDVQREWKKGDRIATFIHGGNDSQPEDGAFGEYCVAKGELGLAVRSPYLYPLHFTWNRN